MWLLCCIFCSVSLLVLLELLLVFLVLRPLAFVLDLVGKSRFGHKWMTEAWLAASLFIGCCCMPASRRDTTHMACLLCWETFLRWTWRDRCYVWSKQYVAQLSFDIIALSNQTYCGDLQNLCKTLNHDESLCLLQKSLHPILIGMGNKYELGLVWNGMDFQE